MIDWTVVLSSLIGTAAGATIATALTVWFAKRERPVPLWHFGLPTNFRNAWEDGFELVDIVVSNVGNATAHEVTVTFRGSEPSSTRPFTAMLAPGESITGTFVIELRGERDRTTLTDTRERIWPPNGLLELRWKEAPKLSKTKVQQHNIAKPLSV